MARAPWEIDDRTRGMADDHLRCRERGHHWERLPMQRGRRADLLKTDEVELRYVCLPDLGCRGGMRTHTRARHGFLLTGREYKVSAGYDVPRDHDNPRGTLHREEILAAKIWRE